MSADVLEVMLKCKKQKIRYFHTTNVHLHYREQASQSLESRKCSNQKGFWRSVVHLPFHLFLKLFRQFFILSLLLLPAASSRLPKELELLYVRTTVGCKITVI